MNNFKQFLILILAVCSNQWVVAAPTNNESLKIIPAIPILKDNILVGVDFLHTCNTEVEGVVFDSSAISNKKILTGVLLRSKPIRCSMLPEVKSLYLTPLHIGGLLNFSSVISGHSGKSTIEKNQRIQYLPLKIKQKKSLIKMARVLSAQIYQNSSIKELQVLYEIPKNLQTKNRYLVIRPDAQKVNVGVIVVDQKKSAKNNSNKKNKASVSQMRLPLSLNYSNHFALKNLNLKNKKTNQLSYDFVKVDQWSYNDNTLILNFKIECKVAPIGPYFHQDSNGNLHLSLLVAKSQQPCMWSKTNKLHSFTQSYRGINLNSQNIQSASGKIISDLKNEKIKILRPHKMINQIDETRVATNNSCDKVLGFTYTNHGKDEVLFGLIATTGESSCEDFLNVNDSNLKFSKASGYQIRGLNIVPEKQNRLL